MTRKDVVPMHVYDACFYTYIVYSVFYGLRQYVVMHSSTQQLAFGDLNFDFLLSPKKSTV